MKTFLVSISILFLAFNCGAQSTTVRPLFKDTQLKELLANSQEKSLNRLIYVWSPRMPLSILGVEELSQIAYKFSLPLTVLVDPAAVESEIISSARGNPLLKNSSRLDSATLVSMSMSIHYPSLVLIKNGKLLRPSRPGYDEPERVEDYLMRRLK